MSSTSVIVRTINRADRSELRMMHDVFQRAYQIEGELIGIDAFPPLERTVQDLEKSDGEFIGAWFGTDLAGVIEVLCERQELHIDALVVDPRFFRMGIATQLMRNAMDACHWQTALVETATANAPALKLYEHLGFVRQHTWTTETGIRKVRLCCQAHN